jgi:hypothetical protein
MSGGHSGHADEWIIAHCGQSFQCHVAGSLDSPFIVLLKQDGADEACDGGLVGKDSDHVCPALDLTVEAFQWIGAVQLRPVLGWEAHIGEHVRLGAVHQNGKLGQLRPELIGDGAPLPGGIRRIIPAATALLRARCRDDGDSRAAPLGGTRCLIQTGGHSFAKAGIPHSAILWQCEDKLRYEAKGLLGAYLFAERLESAAEGMNAQFRSVHHDRPCYE